MMILRIYYYCDTHTHTHLHNGWSKPLKRISKKTDNHGKKTKLNHEREKKEQKKIDDDNGHLHFLWSSIFIFFSFHDCFITIIWTKMIKMILYTHTYTLRLQRWRIFKIIGSPPPLQKRQGCWKKTKIWPLLFFLFLEHVHVSKQKKNKNTDIIFFFATQKWWLSNTEQKKIIVHWSSIIVVNCFKWK